MELSHFWTKPLNVTHSLEVLETIAAKHLEYDGDICRSLRVAFAECGWRALAGYTLSYSDDSDAMDLIHARSAIGLFEKFEQLPLGIDKEGVAYGKFRLADEVCGQLNAIMPILTGRGRSAEICAYPPAVLLIEKIRKKVKTIMGRCPSISELDLSFGPGSTTSTKKNTACPTVKFAAGMQCSAELANSGFLPALLREVPHWTSCFSRYSIDKDQWLIETVPVDVVPGRLEFVPKNAKTYRSIVVEPSLNGFLQQGLGRWLRDRLLRVGVDIRDQSLNQRLARQGSLDGSLATIDLSSASDSISRELVRALVPDDWFSLLYSATTRVVVYRGMEISQEKFCSMGNGFTFPLETILFYAITAVACPHDAVIRAYGDDIICPTSCYNDVVGALSTCGFSVNTKKSFATGPFRESCGRDYFKGVLIRPFYQKELVSARTLFVWHNFLVRFGLDEIASAVKSFIPRSLRLYGPDGYGDGHLISPVFPSSFIRRNRGWSGFVFETLQASVRRLSPRFPGDWVSPLYQIYRRGDDPLDLVSRDKAGWPLWPLPGVDEYKRIKIYALS